MRRACIGNPNRRDSECQKVTLKPDGKCCAGTFKLDVYDTSGNGTVSFTGTVKATRITPNTSIKELF